MSDTIFALSTPTGRSGIAVLRVSGSESWISAKSLIKKDLVPRQACFTALVDEERQSTIDHALVLPFKAPKSFTGEDMIEYHIHGSRAVIEELSSYLAARPNHRLAEPGEFTRRAFENDKLDLTEAEAIADLIDAQTQAQKIQALNQLEGSLSHLYNGWTERLTKILAHAEADIEFPDEDLPDGISPDVLNAIQQLRQELGDHLNDNRRGERLRDGIKIAVIGAPNAGKSSLINALAQRDVAIISDMAGTTRDVIDVHLDIAGYPVILSDTAGLRPSQLGQSDHDRIEGEGIRRALQKAQEADLKILLFDGTQTTPDSDTTALIDQKTLIVINKADRAQEIDLQSIKDYKPTSLSAKTGTGIDALLKQIESHCARAVDSRETSVITRERHRRAVQDTAASLERSVSAALPELMAEDLRLAMRALGRITGRVDVEDLLDVVFNDFCIGK